MTQREVILEGGLPWGFRMHGGVDLKTPLKISRVNPGSKAAQRGIREGDLITTINGRSTKNLANIEAHNLLKNSGSRLKLGLNEDIEGSPKRRQYRTIHHETHQETVKRSSVSYSIKETLETPSRKENNNEFEASKRSNNDYTNGKNIKENGRNVTIVTDIPVSQISTSSSSSPTSTPSTLVPEGKNLSSDHAIVSRQSSYSNCSSIPDEGLSNDYQELEGEEMNDGQERMSKSKKRRQRRKNSLTRSRSQENENKIDIKEVTQETISETFEEEVKTSEESSSKTFEILKLKRFEHKYKVESPKEIKIEHVKSTKDKKLKAKSKSLDDDELIKIQELSEVSESEEVKVCPSNVIISEASSEENLIDDSDSNIQKQKRSTLNEISLKLNDNNQIESVSHISPEEESQLRRFLGGLNLIISPEESAKDLYEKTIDLASEKTKKVQTRKELQEYFMPMADNPRFLDAISEETSDLSDKEAQSASKREQQVKQTTPDKELRQVPPPIPPRKNKSKILSKYANQLRPSAVLVETKILEPEKVQEDICSTKIISESSEKVEVVYLNESSDSSSGEQVEESAEDEKNTLGQTGKALVDKNVQTGSKIILQDQQELTSQKLVQTTDQLNNISNDTVPKPTLVDNLELESNESLTTTFTSQLSSSTKISKTETSPDAFVDIAILSELTPPPTPDMDVSKQIQVVSETTLDKQILFDYTKVPNVLIGKEPEFGFQGLKRRSEEIDLGKIQCEKTDFNKESSSEKKEIKNTEIQNVKSVHVEKKIINGQLEHLEVRKVKVDEISKDGDVEIKKDFEENIITKNALNKEEENQVRTSDTKIDLSNVTTTEKEEEKQGRDILNIEEKPSLQNDLKNEGVLKHIMMVSKDSNKTDSQKLFEFENIRKINTELKNRINKQELFGAMRSQSIDEKLKKVNVAIVEDVDEYIPTKDLVQRRVKEFSGETKEHNEESVLKQFITEKRDINEQKTETSNLVKSRLIMFSEGRTQNEEGSVLKHLILTKDENTSDSEAVQKEAENKEKNFPINVEKELLIEKTIPIVVDGFGINKDIENNEIKLDHDKNENDLPTKTQEKIIDQNDSSKKQIIIPVEVEIKDMKQILDKKESKINKTVEDIANEKIIPIRIEENIADMNRKQSDLKAETNNFEKTQEGKEKERIIPITVEKELINDKLIPIETDECIEKDSSNAIQNEIIIPVQIEKRTEDKENDKKFLSKSISSKLNETSFEKDDYNNKKESIFEITTSSLKKISQSLENISTKSKDIYSNKSLKDIKESKVVKEDKLEKIIPIEVENEPIGKEICEKSTLAKILSGEVKKLGTTEAKIESNKEIKIPIKIENENKAKSNRDKKGTNIEKNRIPENNETLHTNILSSSRRGSFTSESSDSEESSRCTAKYNPNSSIADVTSITKEEENSGMKQLYEPLSLRSIVLDILVSLPFGEEILKELADVSKSIESYTNKIPFRFSSVVSNSGNDRNNAISVKEAPEMPGPWCTEKDVYQNQYEQNGKKIIEHHEKFSTRRSFNEDEPHVAPKASIDERENEVMSPNRLLTIIREEPNEPENPNDFLYFEDNSRQRLKAKNLGEWLTLARNKSKSTSNLDSTNIPINNLRRTFNYTDAEATKFSNIRRCSLPQEFYEQQLWDIMEKEREIQRELEQLEDEKRKIQAEMAPSRQRQFEVDDFYVSKQGDFAERRESNDNRERPASMPVFPTEFFRQKMYNEYMDKYSEREERKQQKVIKISSSNDLNQEPKVQKHKEIIHPIELEREFMDKVKAKKLGRSRDNVNNDELNKPEDVTNNVNQQNVNADEPPVIVLDGDKIKGVDALPKHLQEFVDELATPQDDSIWSPGQQRQPPTQLNKSVQRTDSQIFQGQKDDPVSPVWTPKSANSSPTVERKEFRPLNFRSPILSRKNRTQSETIQTPESTSSEPPWKLPEGSSDTAINLSSTLDRRLPYSQSSPGFGSFSTTPRLPKAQNPTITLLQKAREGQLPRGAHYIDQDKKVPNDRPPIKYPGEILYHIKNEYTNDSDSERPKKMADLASRKFEGIGPTTKDGMPLILRSEVKDKDQSKWYKRMYDTIHKQKPHRDEFITIKYKQKRAQYPYTSGYLSEPEPGAYDSDFTDYKYATLDRRRAPQTQEYIGSSATMPRSVPDKSYSSSDIVRNTQDKYKIQPGRIENYVPGHSSISEKEAKKWWDEVMDIFDGHLEQQSRMPPQKPRSFINQALKESGYESDSTLIFKRKEDTANQLSPKEQREAYKIIQRGGDVPFQGLRRGVPERPKEPDLPPPPPPPKSQGGVKSQDSESPRKYVENEVTIHYKTPVRTEIKEYVSEDELAHRQAEAMKKIYEEERKRKYLQVSKSLQELQDMKSRRHTDNFIPSQKSPISLNRYDDFDDITSTPKTRPRSPEPRLVARALYNFVGHTSRELTFRKGDLIYVRRQVDKNWYEGELNAMVGLFPVNYVEIVPYEGVKTTPRKAHEGQARAKYNFVAQTHLELSLAKGELVTITRRVDDNWFEGKIGGRKGIFPVSYVEILIDPSDPPPSNTKPVASPAAHSLLLNGSAQGKESMGSHLYTPNIPNPLTVRDSGYHHAKPIQLTSSGTYSTLPKLTKNPMDQTLHIETQSEPIPYRALYKYAPQNDDELELLEGDTVYVLEKCDDGWFVGSSDRTGAFGTFPGNYVEKI